MNNRPPAQPAWRRWPVGRLFTTLRASVLHRALQTFRATRSMFTTLYAGIRRSQTHTYARSLKKLCTTRKRSLAHHCRANHTNLFITFDCPTQIATNNTPYKHAYFIHIGHFITTSMLVRPLIVLINSKFSNSFNASINLSRKHHVSKTTARTSIVFKRSFDTAIYTRKKSKPSPSHYVPTLSPSKPKRKRLSKQKIMWQSLG